MNWSETTLRTNWFSETLSIGVDMCVSRLVGNQTNTWILCRSIKGDIKIRKELNLVEASMIIKNNGLIGRWSDLFECEQAYRTKNSWDKIDEFLSQRP